MRGLLSLMLLSTLSLSSVLAVDPYQTKPAGMKPICDNSYVEIKNLPPLRDQGVYGLCYAHSSLLLLEHLRCSRSSSPSTCYKNAGSVLHLARFNTQNGQRIVAGGYPGNVLENFRYNGGKLASESCAPYEKWSDLAKLSPQRMIQGNMITSILCGRSLGKTPPMIINFVLPMSLKMLDLTRIFRSS